MEDSVAGGGRGGAPLRGLFPRAGFIVQVETAQHARSDRALAVAGSTQIVTVEAAASSLSPDGASIGTTIGNTTVELTEPHPLLDS